MDWVPDASGGPYVYIVYIGVNTWGAIEEAGHWFIRQCLLDRCEPAPLGHRLGSWLLRRVILVSSPGLFWFPKRLCLEIHAIDFSLRLSYSQAWNLFSCYLF